MNSIEYFHFFTLKNKSLRALWIVSHYVETTHDLKLKHVIGACLIEIPKRVWQKGNGDTSQETIMYAVDGWATWCLHSPIESVHLMQIKTVRCTSNTELKPDQIHRFKLHQILDR